MLQKPSDRAGEGTQPLPSEASARYEETSFWSASCRFCLMSFTCQLSVIESASMLPTALAVNVDAAPAAAALLTTTPSGATVTPGGDAHPAAPRLPQLEIKRSVPCIEALPAAPPVV